MVEICEYKGYKIFYSDGVFQMVGLDVDKYGCMIIEANFEADVKSRFDTHERELKDREESKRMAQKVRDEEEARAKAFSIPEDLSIVLEDVSHLKKPLSVMVKLLTDAQVYFTSEGIKFIGMDPANVAMIIFKIDTAACKEYMFKDDFSCVIDVKKLYETVRVCKPHDKITIRKGKDKEETRRLHLVITSRTILEYDIPIEMIENVTKEPQLKYNSVSWINSQELHNVIMGADRFAESTKFIMENDRFSIEAENETVNYTARCLIENEVTRPEVTQKAKYSLEYLKKMLEAKKVSKSVMVSFNTDYPLSLNYEIPHEIKMTLILAPRVEEF